MNTALVIIPTYNEAENIVRMIDVLSSVASVDVLVVDDNSPDGTGMLVEKLQATCPHVHLLRRPGKAGLGRAYIAGFQYALEKSYEFIFEMDADFSHNPNDVPRLLEAIQTADLVIGSRYIKGISVINWPLYRLLLSYFASKYVRWITGLPVADPTGGFKCFRRQVLETIDLKKVKSNGYAFQIEMTYKVWKKGFRIQELPIVFTDRFCGKTKMSNAIVREAIWGVWKLRLGWM
jgi:dolichol-phosphate mannosyltransferase